MTKTAMSLREIRDAVHLACRAPSYHNSQPWKWVLESATLRLFLDTDRLVNTDSSGRQALLSCLDLEGYGKRYDTFLRTPPAAFEAKQDRAHH